MIRRENQEDKHGQSPLGRSLVCEMWIWIWKIIRTFKSKEKGTNLYSLSLKNIYIRVGGISMHGHILINFFWCSSPRTAFLNDTHIGTIAFLQKYHAHAIWLKIAFTCNFICMQFCQYGCLSTRLHFRNAVLGDEDPEINKSLVFCAMKLRLDFPLYFFELPLYF